MFQVGLKNLPRGRAFDRQARAHPLHALMLASKVTFFPQLRGTLANARSPRLDHAYTGASEMLEPISSTNTNRSA